MQTLAIAKGKLWLHRDGLVPGSWELVRRPHGGAWQTVVTA
jgi:hypothetical protein